MMPPRLFNNVAEKLDYIFAHLDASIRRGGVPPAVAWANAIESYAYVYLNVEKDEVCSCKEWELGIIEINNQIRFTATQSAGPKYLAPAFHFCPWCGKKSREF